MIDRGGEKCAIAVFDSPWWCTCVCCRIDPSYSWPHGRRLQLVDLVYHSVRKIKDCFAIPSNTETSLIFPDRVVVFFIVLSAESAAQVVDWSSDSLMFFFTLIWALCDAQPMLLCLALSASVRVRTDWSSNKGYTSYSYLPLLFSFFFFSPHT